MERELRKKYAKNYNNKLNCDIFTTIRKYTPEKLKFMQDSINTPFANIIQDKPYNKAILLRARRVLVDDLPDELIMLDTGLENPEHARKLMANFGCGPAQEAILQTFKRIKE